ncbi:MAG TPA: SDR family oxidoreductase [Gemmatimonadaceae bacterium]|nr:SDR family oxidoreductase [Gemmatimonadaceae bacterium]
MRLTLKPVSEQVIVITGASSGIGLVTAELAAEEGACVVLAARNERDLAKAVTRIHGRGGRATYHVADVSEPDQVTAIADEAVRAFGRIDTWVNNAAVALYGRLADLPLEDMRRQFDVNYWGAVYGSLTAVPHLARQGGALINVASALADRAIPLQGNYCAAKHALKAFTDSLRMELEEEGWLISVTLLKPGSIDTPLFEKARSYMGVEPQPVPPVYAPEAAAHAILECAAHPHRDVIVGGMGKVLSLTNVAPRLADRYMERKTFDSQRTDIPLADSRRDNLYEPVADDGGARGRNWSGRTADRSLYTEAVLHPRKALASAAAGAAVVAGLRRRLSR